MGAAEKRCADCAHFHRGKPKDFSCWPRWYGHCSLGRVSIPVLGAIPVMAHANERACRDWDEVERSKDR